MIRMVIYYTKVCVFVSYRQKHRLNMDFMEYFIPNRLGRPALSAAGEDMVNI